MSSTDAGTPAAGNGQPPAEPAPRRDLRDSRWGKVALLLAVLFLAFLVSRSCANQSQEITQDEAVELAKEHAAFEPCAEEICQQVRFLQQGIPPRPYWAVVLSEHIDAQGRPTRVQSFLVNAQTGAVSLK
jgi:hypothetical protein